MPDIDPGTETNPAVAEWESNGLRAPDMQAVRSWRLQRLRSQLEAEDAAGIVLFDPLNIRYAVDATNMQVWCTHNAVRYAFVATDGPVILFDLARCEHLTAHLPLIDEVRPATGWFFFENGPRESEAADLSESSPSAATSCPTASCPPVTQTSPTAWAWAPSTR